jgi:hypothetical protein
MRALLTMVRRELERRQRADGTIALDHGGSGGMPATCRSCYDRAAKSRRPGEPPKRAPKRRSHLCPCWPRTWRDLLKPNAYIEWI